MIDIQDLALSFGRQAVLRGVSLQVGAGESYGLLGESGSGKSTILRAITGLAPFSAGRIGVHGQSLPKSGKRDAAFLRAVQMVFQDPYGSLHPRHTVDRILREPLHILGFDGIDGRVARALDEVGLSAQHRYRYPHQLSGGQRQRIAIARALITEPKMLLLDEPTSALDVSVQAEILNLLQTLRRERGLTYLFVSHNLPVVAHICDRIAILADGVVAEEITASELTFGAVTSAVGRDLLAASAGYRRRQAAPQPAPVTRPAPVDQDDLILASYQLSAGLR